MPSASARRRRDASPLGQAMCRELFIDESSQTKHRYLLLGGMITRCREAELSDALQEARAEELPHGELGWVKVSRSKLDAYKRFVDIFFTSDLDFHSIVVDTHRIDDATYNGGCRSTGFDKELYQLLIKFDRLYSKHNFHVYLDQRSAKGSLEELRKIVNQGIRKRSIKRDWPIRRLHFRNSADCQALQLVDVLLGSIAFHVNGHRWKPNAAPAKCELSDYILRRAKVQNPLRDTCIEGKFTIWHRQLKEPKRKR